MRRPRLRQPRQFRDLTVRCHHSEFRFKPTRERTNLLGYSFAKAQEKYPGVRIGAIVVMGNHMHVCIYDENAEASEFMRDAIGHAAKGINRIDGVRGALVERRFSEIPILDRESFAERIAYAVMNPVKAKLVRSHREWKGLCVFASGNTVRHRYSNFHRDRYEKAIKAGKKVERADFTDVAELEIGGVDAELAAMIEAAIERRETEVGRTRSGVLGMKRVLQTGVFDRPKMSKRSAMPLCFAALEHTRREFVAHWCAFVAAFRAASRALRDGDLNVEFPPFCFRPGLRCT